MCLRKNLTGNLKNHMQLNLRVWPSQARGDKGGEDGMPKLPKCCVCLVIGVAMVLMDVGTLSHLVVCDICAKVRSADKEKTSSKVLCMGHDRPCFGVFLSRFVALNQMRRRDQLLAFTQGPLLR